ncbi:MAG: type IV secretion system DNA-binding domain-containing protein [Acidobacteria bacterium]|nr:type IV secretion system DNA-binding domain-containing protein [Acidobacteriota bacterium]
MATPSSQSVTLLGRTTFRNVHRVFGIRQRDRLSHVYLIGRTGVGKSTLLASIARQDVDAGHGLALFDPHGDLADDVAGYAKRVRPDDLLYLNAPDPAQPFTFNPLAEVSPERRSLASANLLDVFKKIWADSWGPRLEHILRNCLLTLLDQPEPSLGDMPRLLHDTAYRKRAVLRVANPQVRHFWLVEWEGYGVRFRAEAAAPLDNKVGAFVTDPVLQRVLLARNQPLSLRRIMDEGRVLVVNLSKGRIGEPVAALLGSLLLASLGLAGLGRADVPETARRDFFTMLDEFQFFITQSLAGMLAELRKFHVGLTLAHQFLGQLDPLLRNAVLGNVGSLVCFRIGAEDAETLEREFVPDLRAEDLSTQPNFAFYTKIMNDGRISRPFSAETFR